MPLAAMRTVWAHLSPQQLTFPCLVNGHVNLWDGQNSCTAQSGPPSFCKSSSGSLGWGGSVAALVKRVNLQRHQNCASVTCVRNETGLREGNNGKFCKSWLQRGLLDWVWLCFLFHNGALKLNWTGGAWHIPHYSPPPPPPSKMLALAPPGSILPGTQSLNLCA